jgi:hypothetical protein
MRIKGAEYTWDPHARQIILFVSVSAWKPEAHADRLQRVDNMRLLVDRGVSSESTWVAGTTWTQLDFVCRTEICMHSGIAW